MQGGQVRWYLRSACDAAQHTKLSVVLLYLHGLDQERIVKGCSSHTLGLAVCEVVKIARLPYM